MNRRRKLLIASRLWPVILLMWICRASAPANGIDAPGPTTQPASFNDGSPGLFSLQFRLDVGGRSNPSSRPTSAPATTAQAGGSQPQAPFKLTEAATEAESASIALRGIEADLSNDRETALVKRELPYLTTEIDARSDESSKLLASSPSLQLLGSQEQDWLGISQNLDDWKKLLQRRRAQLEQDQSTLTELHDRWAQAKTVLDYWNAHRSTKEGQQILDTASPPITQMQTKIATAMSDMRQARIDAAQLAQTVDVQDARVLEMLDSVRQARDQAFNRLFVRNSLPLWEVPIRSTGETGLIAQGRDSLTRQLEAIVAYLKRRFENVGLQIALLLVLAVGLFRVRAVVRKWSAEDPALKPVTLVFASPIATALVLSLLFSGWIYPRAPRMFWAIIGAAALIPTVLILRRLLDRRLFPILNALVVFYFLDQLRSIVAVVPVVARFLLMLEMLAAAILLILFVRSTRAEQKTERVWRIVRVLGWVWTAAFIAAFFCDILGYDSLSNLVGDATLGSAYFAVVLYACVRIGSGLLVIALRSRPFVWLQMVRRHQPLLLARLRRALYWLAAAGWVVGVLVSFSIAGPLWGIVQKVMSAELAIGGLHLVVGHLLAFLVTVWISVRLSRFLRFVLEEDVYDRLALPSGIPYAVSKMVNYIVLLVGFFIAISTLGVEMTQLTILASAFTLGIGFGLQNIFNNFVSGVILLFERPVRVGDVIQMDDTTGVVGHIGIRASIIRTSDSSEIIVPNGNLISGKVTNWTLSNRQRGLMVPLTLTSSAEPHRVIELLQNVAAAQPLVTKNPPPQAFLTHLGADSFSYELHVWTNNAEQWVKLRSELAVALNAELARQNIALK